MASLYFVENDTAIALFELFLDVLARYVKKVTLRSFVCKLFLDALVRAFSLTTKSHVLLG